MIKIGLLCSLLLFSSCSTHKGMKKSAFGSDSLRQHTRLQISSAAVPQSFATLKIPSADLRELPPAAVYTSKSGQATASVRFLHDTLFVTASCDSLQALVYRYENEIEALSHHTETQTKETQTYGGLHWLVLLGISGFVLVCLNRARR